MGRTQVLSALGLALALGVLGGNYTYAEEAASAVAGRQSSAAVATSQSARAASVAAQSAEVAVAGRSAGASNNVTAAASYAESVLQETKNVTNNEYAGVYKYMQGLVVESKKSENQGSQELADALNEGALATSLLMGTYGKQNSASVAEPTGIRNATYAVQNDASTPEVKAVETTARVAQGQAAMQAVVAIEPETATTKQQSVAMQATAAEPAQKVQLANATIKVTVGKPEEVAAENAEAEDLEKIADSTSEDEIEVPQTGEVKTNFGMLALAGVGVVAATLGATAVILRSKKRA